MFISRLYVLLDIHAENPGPADPDGGHPGPEILADIGGRLSATTLYDDGVDFRYMNDGAGGDNLLEAIQQTETAPGRPLVLILSVSAPLVNGSPIDGTLIEYSPGHQDAADQIAAHLVTLAPEGVPWAKVVRENANLSPATSIVRVTVGSVIGPAGAISLLDPAWRALFTSQLRAGVLAATLYTEV